MSIQQLDEKILLALNGLVEQSNAFDTIVKFIAVYTIYAIPIALIVLWFKKIREVGIRAALAGIVTWMIASPLIAQLWFRARPDLAEIGGKEFLFHRPTYSFPSDHAGFLAALTISFYLAGFRKIALVFLIATVLVSLGRVIIGFHWPTDIIGGWIVGALVAYAVHAGRQWVDRYVSRPAIRLAQRLGLA